MNTLDCPYNILGVQSNATHVEIKKAYKSIALARHPDKGGCPDAFKLVNAAYSIVGNVSLRKLYDDSGARGLDEYNAQPTGSVDTHFHEFDNIFGGIFGNRDQEEPMRSKHPSPVDYDIQITMNESCLGTTRVISLQYACVCLNCRGIGTSNGTAQKKCHTCKGEGRMTRIMTLAPGMFQRSEHTCTSCKGECIEKDIFNMCDICDGRGVTSVAHSINVNVPPGVQTGMRLEKIAGAGGVVKTGPAWEPTYLTRDFIPVITCVDIMDASIDNDTGAETNNADSKHNTLTDRPVIHRKGDHLFVVYPINAIDAVCGVDKMLRHPDGSVLTLHAEGDAILDTHSLFMARGRGMPRYQNPVQTGDLLVRFDIYYPTTCREFSERFNAARTNISPLCEDSVVGEVTLIQGMRDTSIESFLRTRTGNSTPSNEEKLPDTGNRTTDCRMQ
jgi:DnaJ-class molecular chaperone